MQRTSLAGMHCSVARTLDIIGEWWTPLIIRDAFLGSARFEDLQRSLGIARNVLADRLETLVTNGILERRPYQEHPPRDEYVLTQKGRELFPIIATITAWGDRWTAGEAGPPLLLVHQPCGHAATVRTTCDHCGDLVSLDNTRPTPGPGAPGAGRALSEPRGEPGDPDEPSSPGGASEPNPALAAVAASGVAHRVVRIERATSAEDAAARQGIPTDALLRTIVVRRGADDYLFVLVPAGRQFDWARLRAHLGVSRLSLPEADEALRVTGYVRYTITPFGASHAWPVIVDAAVLSQPVVSVGGGAAGVNLHLAPADLVAALRAEVVVLTG